MSDHFATYTALSPLTCSVKQLISILVNFPRACDCIRQIK